MCLCGARKEGDGRYYVEIECVPLSGPRSDVAVLRHALSVCSLLSQRPSTLATNYEPKGAEELAAFRALLKACSQELPGTHVACQPMYERLHACECATGRFISDEALKTVTRGNVRLEDEASTFGTPLNSKLFTEQNRLLRELADVFLTDPTKCSTAPHACTSFKQQQAASGGFWQFYNTLWNTISVVGKPARAAGSKRKQRYQQEQQWRREQRQRHSSHAAGASGTAAEGSVNGTLLAAECPQPEHLPVSELQQFLEAKVPGAGASISLAACSSAAQAQVWECRRLLQCGRVLTSTGQRRRGALAVFRLTSDSSSSSSAGLSSRLRHSFKQLALMIHPDKVPAGLQAARGLFTDAFKVVSAAYDLLV